MARTMNVSEARFRAWLDGLSEEERDFSNLIGRAWQLLRGDESRAEEDFNYLIWFVVCKRKRQNELIRRLCRQEGMEFWNTLAQRAACLYARVKPRVPVLEAKRGTMSADKFPGYLHKVLEYNLLVCNQECVAELQRTQQIVRSEGELNRLWLGTGSMVGAVVNPRVETLEEIVDRLDLREQARQLRESLARDWDPRQLNVLCHYYELFRGVQTHRLSGESRDNVNQLHSRMRTHLLDYLERGNYDGRVARVFFCREMKKLCQDTAPLDTYMTRMGVTDDTPI